MASRIRSWANTMSLSTETHVLKIRRFGNYEIIRKLGRSMTDVYLALDPEKNQRVVLKLIEQSRDRATQILIEAERRGAQIQKQLRELDPRILEIYEIGEQSGCFYVTMEFFEGSSVAELIETERRLDPVRAARYAIEVLSQLQTLHSFVSDVDGRRRAVVHGDIKPSNIQIGANGEVRLLDFGIAKMITYTQNLTRHNLGSPTYCSPERLAKAQVDAQSDLWALAVSLYEMVAGMPPYQAASTRKLETLIQSRRPPRALPESCPPRLRAILFKALAADIQRRYASTKEFTADLRAFLENRRTVAEDENLPSWDANETIQTTAPVKPGAMNRAAMNLEKLRRTAISGNSRVVAAALFFGLIVAMTVTLFYRFREESRPLREGTKETSAAQIESDWRLYKWIERENSFLGQFSPAYGLASPMRANLLAAAGAVIDAYRNSSDPALTDFDWSRARLALNYALQLDPADTEARGELALCDGYINLIGNPKLPGAQRSETEFQLAAADLPRSPDPHLGLARLYVYVSRNAGLALGQFSEAERRGFRLGPRELEQEADGYLYRAESELRQAGGAAVPMAEEDRWLRQAWDDLERARVLYEPLAGFSNVSAGLDHLYTDRKSQQQLRASLTAAQSAAWASAKQKPKSKPPARRKIVAPTGYGSN
jgi:serine/threonine protein kinase